MNISELARVVTQKIRDEIDKIKTPDYAEVYQVIPVAGGHYVKVMYVGATTPSIEIPCLKSYTPAVGDYVVIVYPKNSSGIVIGSTP